MPLDPGIPLSGKPVQVASPYDILDLQLRTRQQQRLEQQAERADRQQQLESEQQARAGEGVATLNRVMQERAQSGQGFDRKALEQQMAAAGQWDLYTKIKPYLDVADKASEETSALEQKMRERKNAGLAALAYGVHLAGNTPDAYQVAKQAAKARFGLTDEELAPYEAMMAERPDAIGQITTALIGQDPEYAKLFHSGQAKPATEKAVRTRQIETVDEQGNPIVRVVADEPGQSFPMRSPAAKSADEAKAGSFEDYIGRLAREKGKSLELLSSKDIEEARKRYQQADDRPRVAGADKPKTRGVISGDANRIAELNSSLKDLESLRAVVSGPGATGAGSAAGAALPGWVTSITGLGEASKQRQAVIDRVKQVIGKALEGGVLRKEDELKYKRILPTIVDTPEIVKTKLNGLEEALIDKRRETIDALSDAGYDTSKFEARQAGSTSKEAPAPAGKTRERWERGPDGKPRKVSQ